MPYKATWPSCGDHATMCYPCHLVTRLLGQWTWDLRVPTLFLFHLFSSYCMVMLLLLLCSGYTCACSHFQLGGQLYVPLCSVHIPVSSTSMWTAAIVTDTHQPPS